MDANQASAVAPGDMVQVLQPGGPALATVAQIVADPLALCAALAARADALAARLAIVEGRPEEVAHFGASAAFPNAAALAPVTLTLTGLAPARPGDVLKAGESVAVQPLAALPDGLAMKGPPTVPADGTVVLRFTSSVALTAGAPIPWAISALR